MKTTNNLIIETEKEKYKIEIIGATIPKQYFYQNGVIEPAYCLEKCCRYSNNKNEKGYLKSCPCRNNFYSCSGGELDIREMILEEKTDPVLVCCKLSFAEEYDSEFISDFFNGNISSKRRYIYQKLGLVNDALWILFRKLFSRDLIFSFGPCRLCGQDCTINSGLPCRMKTIYSMERVGIRVDKIVKEFLGFELQWLNKFENGYERPQYLCSVGLLFTEKINISEELVKIFNQKLEKKEIASYDCY